MVYVQLKSLYDKNYETGVCPSCRQKSGEEAGSNSAGTIYYCQNTDCRTIKFFDSKKKQRGDRMSLKNKIKQLKNKNTGEETRQVKLLENGEPVKISVCPECQELVEFYKDLDKVETLARCMSTSCTWKGSKDQVQLQT